MVQHPRDRRGDVPAVRRRRVIVADREALHDRAAGVTHDGATPWYSTGLGAEPEEVVVTVHRASDVARGGLRAGVAMPVALDEDVGVPSYEFIELIGRTC